MRRVHGARSPRQASSWTCILLGACLLALMCLALFIPSHVIYMSLVHSYNRVGIVRDPRVQFIKESKQVISTSRGMALPFLHDAAPTINAPVASQTDPPSPPVTASKLEVTSLNRPSSSGLPVNADPAVQQSLASPISSLAAQPPPPPVVPASESTLKYQHVQAPVRAPPPPPREGLKGPALLDISVKQSPRQWQKSFKKGDVAGVSKLDFASAGKVKPWSGDFMDNGAMEAMLAARSYKKEIIITTADGGHLEEFFNLVLDFRDLKMEHTVVFMDHEGSCTKAASLMSNLGCTWAKFLYDDHPKPYWTRIVHMWLMRWLLFNSIVRRGYNALILDTDNSVRMDPYMFLKSEHFLPYQQVVSFDEGIPEINCGAQYGQNIAADGPVAWITAEVVDRLLRWTENWDWFVRRLNVTKDLHGDTFFRVTFEQSVFRDATCSAMLQRPRFYHSLSPRDKARWPFPWWDTGWRERHTKACRWWNKTSETQLPEQWQLFARVAHERYKYVNLKLPYSHGEYPEEWGHDPFPPRRGRFSEAFLDWLRRDVPALWPDVDSSEDPGNKRERVEKMLQAPMWLLSRWIEIGERLGAWNLHPPMGVINHVLVPGGRDNVLKAGMMKIYNWWHWDVNYLLNGPGLFKSADKVGLAANDTALPRLISFAPSVELLFSKREAVHPAFLASLAKAAIISGRVPVYPLIPCDSPWIQHREAKHRHRGSLEATNMVDRFLVPHGPRDDLRCLWKAWACRKCHKVGMPWYEFERALEDLPLHSRYPHEGNTVFMEHLQLQRRQVDGLLPWPSEAVQRRPPPDTPPLQVAHRDLLLKLEELKDCRVVWVGSLFETSDREPNDFNFSISEKLSSFDKEIQLCPEC